jgi:hypothetical protein
MARKRTDTTDPYAPPPMYHDRSGRFVRLGLMALLLAGLGVGYFAWSATSPQQTATIAPVAQQQQLADSGYRTQPEQIPQAQPVTPTPPTAAPAPERRRAAPAARSSRSAPAAEEATPPPVSSVPTTPAPLPPATATPQLPDTAPPAQG